MCPEERVKHGCRQRKGLMVFLGGILILLFAGMQGWCSAQERSTLQPLFPLRLNHAFPNHRQTFKEVRDLILDNYYSKEITEEALYWAAIGGMLQHISPPDSPELGKIWTAEEYEKVLQSLQGEQVSLGIKSTFNPRQGSLTVTEVMPRSPASRVLKALDRIMRINSQPLKGRSIVEINTLLKGGEGEEVTLTINRDIAIFDVTIRFESLEMQNLVVSRLGEDVALVEIKRFTTDMSKKLRGEMEDLKERGVEGMIIDLRNNPGGVLAEALRIADLFLPEKRIILRTLQRKTNLQNHISGDEKEPFDFDMAVLVNSNTASSAEILVSALQDNKRAVIIGTKTFGKGVFEKTFQLKNDFRVKFITGAMYSPKGRNWQGKGVTPDFLVKQDDSTLSALLKMEPRKRLQKDVAMITAYKLLKR